MEKLVNKIDLIFGFLITSNGLLSKEKFIINIREILFADFNNVWKKKNQKFDFSFSFEERGLDGLRFSYNNFGEKEIFYDKALKIFKLFGNKYEIVKLKNILDELDIKNAVFQTTIGFEWKRGDELPRFKIYFEEIHHGISKSDRIKMVKEISKIINFNYKELDINKDDDIGAICVDFLPDKETQLKVYMISDSVDLSYLEKIFSDKKYLIDLVRNFFNIFSSEKSCFYYIARRFGGGGLSSIKLYKIYEVGGINDFSKSYEEIFKFLKYSKAINDVKKIKELLRFALKNKITFYPVISSMDLPVKGDIKSDLYLSMKV